MKAELDVCGIPFGTMGERAVATSGDAAYNDKLV